jgi:hypothetical protein
MRLLLIGNPSLTHVARHFCEAARERSIVTEIMDSDAAYRAPKWIRRIFWHLLGHRPAHLNAFGRQILATARLFKPDILLSTGVSPIPAPTLQTLRKMGVKLANFSTDDPWSPGQFASWFMGALPSYDHVFTPRQANFEPLKSLNGPRIHLLPFAYAPDLHFPAHEVESPETTDVLFYGNVDPDRSPQLEALVSSGLRLTLYAASRLTPLLYPSFQGYADPATMRRAVAQSPVSLVIGRKSNRDTHAMRSYEVPAMRGCILAEDSLDHRRLYGDAAHYFNDIPSLIQNAKNLIQSTPFTRHTLRDAVLKKIVSEPNTYGDRLDTILRRCCD